MEKTIRIILDAMGGDHAPRAILGGARQAVRLHPELHLLLVGHRQQLAPLLETLHFPESNYSIVHTEEYVTMEEVPREALQKKRNASIALAAKLLAQGQGDALVSAGNTGATILASSEHIPRLPGVERAALAALLPAMRQKPEDPGRTMMLDVGATLHCTTRQLVTFAIMATYYFKEVLGFPDPRVALLNIGEEETKGHSILVETHAQLRQIDEIHFIGNVEGKDIMRGLAEVIVTEGYVGNIVLKSMEGMAENTIEIIKRIWAKSLFYKIGLLLLSPAIKKIKKRIDYTEYGGAPVLGFEKLVVKAHGRSNEKAIQNALLTALAAVEHDLVGKMASALSNALALTEQQ